MSLPNGYTELEWIKSDGGQYIDTGVIADYQSRLIMEAQMDAAQSGATTQYAAYGAGTTNWYFWFTPTLTTYYRIYARRQKIFTAACNSFERFYFELDGGEATFTIGGVTETASLAVSTANSGYPLYLFAMNMQGTTSYQSRMWLWSFKMYANGVLVRDFVPCRNPSGEVGLYDKVNYVFYRNLGTGTFAAGPVKSLTPDAPENITAEMSGGAVILSWTASEDAAGYRVYRSGAFIGETVGTTYTDASVSMYREHEYTVVPYNEHGDGGAAVLSVFAKSLRPLDDLITDRTAADITNRTAKGAYNFTDLNRVTASAEYVHDMLGELGYAVPDQTGRVWSANDIPDKIEMTAHHNAVVGLDVIRYAHEKIELPPNLEKLTYTGANDIEKFLLLCGEAAERIPEGYIYSDEIYGGEFS